MKEVLSEISRSAIQLGDNEFSEQQVIDSWIGFPAPSEEEIERVEKRLGLSFPEEFKTFLKITNGFLAASSVEPSFCSLDKIDYLKNVDSELIEIWTETGNIEVGSKLRTALKVGGIDEEQYFFLIPPSATNGNWEYWTFSAWAPGETIYTSLLDYFNNVLETTTMFIEKK